MTGKSRPRKCRTCDATSAPGYIYCYSCALRKGFIRPSYASKGAPRRQRRKTGSPM